MSKDQILAQLPLLSQTDLKAIQAVIGTLLTKGSPPATLSPNSAQAWLYEALGAWGLGHLNASQMKVFNKNASAALTFMEKNFKVALGNRTKFVSMMRFLIILLEEDLRRKELPITKGILLLNLPRIPEVFENAYPGYLRSGIAPTVMRLIIGE